MAEINGRRTMPSAMSQQPPKGFSASPAGNNNARYGRATPTAAGGGGPRGGKSVNAKMGIKSGMTVEDLKRLTQQRMQQNPSIPATSTANPASAHSPPHPSNIAIPTLNMPVVGANGVNSAASIGTPTHALPPGVPKVGMSVQELKQLTSLRLASQHQQEITGLVSKAVLSNAAKSHYREGLRGAAAMALTPSTTPKRTSAPNVTTPPLRTYGHAPYAQTSSSSPPPLPQYMPQQNGMGMMQARHSIPGRMMKTGHPPPSNMYGYTYTGVEGFNGYDQNQVARPAVTRIQESDVYPVLDLDDDKYASEEQYNALQFPDDSFPPPPPLDEQGGFVSTALPSWSPPPTRSKKIDTTLPSTTFYSQQPSSFFGQVQSQDAGRDQNAIIAPPPGLSRRPSMTVPWQVAEAVLNTPQTSTISGRKTLLSPTTTSNKTLSETSNLFASGPRLTRNESTGLKNPAAEVAAELSALTLSRQRSNGAMAASPGMSMLGVTPPNSGSGNASARRGSFGNAAEFFKFRRRSKSRLELARDLSTSGYTTEMSSTFPNYGSTGGNECGSSRLMPGIDESGPDVPTDIASDGSDDDSDVAGGGSFVSFYNATGIGRRSRGDSLGGLSTLSIPPPPPPPLTDDEDEVESTTSSSKGLPMMSPNGFRLRKVAEMARRGSLSSEDKTRVKDEIIQHSLGLGASNAARILTTKPTSIPIAVPATALAANTGSTPIPIDRPPMSPLPTMLPPPGFQRLQSASTATATPPRNTPKITSNKTLPAGIVRTSSVGIASRSPPKPILMSPNSAARKAMVPVATHGNTGNSVTLEARLADAAQRVADCVSKGDMTGFQTAMDDLDRLRNEASATLLRG